MSKRPTQFILARILPAILIAFSLGLPASASPVTVCAAASLANVLDEFIQAQNGPRSIQMSYAGSATLARQIEAGAPCDIFISANVAWVDYLSERNLLVQNLRVQIAQNRLSAIAPSQNNTATNDLQIILRDPQTLRIAIAEPNSVPVGIYAREALTHADLWDAANMQTIVIGQSVTSVLKWVEKGEVDLGFVYATDVPRSDGVSLVHMFPPESHSPIIYEMVMIADRNTRSTKNVFAFLQSQATQVYFLKAGFEIP